MPLIFQSTHPVWGGTRHPIHHTPVNQISIHPPRVGWDYLYFKYVVDPRKFQSTHPVWGGTPPLARSDLGLIISIHPPRVGWDYPGGPMPAAPSYFNPPTPCGVGQRKVEIMLNIENFNPPTPCGVGPSTGAHFCFFWSFQSTHPVWGGTLLVRPQPIRMSISIHPPRVGWDVEPQHPAPIDLEFQSTHPVWGGTAKVHKIYSVTCAR